MTDYNGKKFSILGDSISTFVMYTPTDGVFYSGYLCRQAGIAGVRDTWWMRIINELGGEFCMNDSWAGTTVSGRAVLCGCSEARTAALGEPDVILVFMGLNDAAYGVPLDEFAADYSLMLSRLRRNYPAAEIWCGTLMQGDYAGSSFFNAEAVMPFEAFNEAIREAAAANSCRVADIASFGLPYDSVDGAHPNYDGMKEIAEWWLKFMRPLEIERKLLIRMPDSAVLDEQCDEKLEITQTYLEGTGGDSAVRVRKTVYPDGKTVYTKNEKKAVSAMTRVEREEHISDEEYRILLSEKRDEKLQVIEKTRWRIPWQGHTLEVDVFPFWKNQAFCEIELESEAEEYSLPDYIELIRDVSAEKEYVNSALAKNIPAED